MVEVSVIFLMYLPFAAVGFALSIAASSACAFPASCCAVKADLSHGRMDDSGLIEPELDLTCLDFLYRARDFESDSSCLRIRHQAARAENFSQASGGLHHVRRGDYGFVIRPAFLNLLDHVFAANEVSAGFLRLANFFAARNHQNAL